MDTPVLQRIIDGIAQRRQILTDWLRLSTPEERRTRTGPAGEAAIREHLQTLDGALQKAEENRLGLCDVCHESVEPNRLEMDYTTCVCIEHLSDQERARLEKELQLSQQVQQALLPHHVPEVRGLRIAAFSQPARIVGGDYFDFVRMRNGAIALMIADVMGKGMPASMLVASLQASLRIIAPESQEPADVVARLNQLFCHNVRLTRFITFFIARYDEATRRLTFCNAGHNPPLLRRSTGAVESLMPTGAAIGLAERASFAQEAITLGAGDRLLLYTDGVVESANADRELYGEERLEEFLAGSGERSAQELIATLRGRLHAFAGTTTPADDTTIIAVSVDS